VRVPPYRIQDNQLCYERPVNGGLPSVTPLCNFAATITEEVVLDDGAEPTNAFVIEGRLKNGEVLPKIRVPSRDFPLMQWPIRQWGARAIVNAGQTTRDRLREAIQRCSNGGIRSRRVFAHTGWRWLDHQGRRRPVYLTAGGAIGRDDVEVELSLELSRYRLPREPQNVVEAMRASLALLRVAPLSITVPAWAAMFRAPLAEAKPVDHSLWIEGASGVLKSSLIAVFLSHFGPFDHLHLPDSWTSTANALENRAFLLKDVPFVIDDYAPKHALDARDFEAKASRLLRAQGNLAGRGRLKSDSSERPSRPPRGMIVSTGEQHPAGQSSILARMYLVKMHKDDVDRRALSAAQRAARLLPHAMSGYIGRLRAFMYASDLPAQLDDRFREVRERAAVDGHLRIPETIAHLWLGLDEGLTYAETIGACTAREAEMLRSEAWAALMAGGAAQALLVRDERPTLRFLRGLATLITQGHVFLLSKDEPTEPTGQRQLGELAGWFDAAGHYLLPEAAYTAVSRFYRDGGEPFPVDQRRLCRELCDEGLADHEDGRHVKMTRVGSETKRLLSLRGEAVERALGEPLPVVSSVTGNDV